MGKAESRPLCLSIAASICGSTGLKGKEGGSGAGIPFANVCGIKLIHWKRAHVRTEEERGEADHVWAAHKRSYE